MAIEEITIPGSVTDDTFTNPTDLVQNTDGWWITETMTAHGNTEVGWLKAQGWIQTGYKAGGVGYPQNFYLKRRRLDSEKVLEALNEDYVQAYNDGRKLNDERFDYIFVVYQNMIQGIKSTLDTISETALPTDGDNEMQLIIDGFQGDYETFAETLQTALEGMLTVEQTAITALKADEIAQVNNFIAAESTALTNMLAITEGIADDFEASQKAEINARFDAELALARQNLVTKGLYNSTLVTSTNAGIERERSRALLAVDDALAKQKIALQNQVSSYQSGVRGRLASFQTQITEMVYNNESRANERMYNFRRDVNKMLYDALTEKNLKWLNSQENLWRLMYDIYDKRYAPYTEAIVKMLDFIERRSDSYPDLNNIADAANSLGAGSLEGGQV